MKHDLATLRDIERQKSFILDQILEAGGELTPALEKSLMNVELQEVKKVDGYIHLMEGLQASEDHYKKLAQKFQAAKQGCEAFRKRLKARIKLSMSDNKLSEAYGTDFRFKLQNRQATLEIDDKKLSVKYCDQHTEWVPNKDRIRDLLESGEKIEGARLVESKALATYVNKKGKK